ncbi:MAG TPA: excisionase family DNA-binding protein [Acidisarcina sp.]
MITSTARAPFDKPVSEDARITALYELLRLEDKVIVTGEGELAPVEVPEVVHDLLLKILKGIQEGKAISILPVVEELTTQQAAGVLGVSRPYFVKLLESKKLPYHLTGSHRRVYLKDLMTYKQYRDRERHEALNRMAHESERAGVYDKVLLPQE